MIALVGSLAYLLGVALLFANYATVDVTLLAEMARPDLATKTALAVMTAGLLIKAAVFPLHGWLPPAHAAAPAPASALLSAIVVKVGFVILLRLWFEAFPAIVAPAGLELLGPAFTWATPVWREGMKAWRPARRDAALVTAVAGSVRWQSFTARFRRSGRTA